MTALKVSVLILIVLCDLYTASLLENLIVDGSFEERMITTSWNMTERVSTWSTTTRPRLILDCLTRHTGRCSAVFDVFNDIQAKFLSQYVNVVEKLGGASAGAILFEFWSSGRHSSKVRAQLDIVYADRHRRMSVVISPAERADYVGADILAELKLDEVFAKSCTMVPNYGPIRAIMVHFALDHKLVTDEFIYIDDVDLRVVAPDETALEDCPLYLASFPASRQVIVDFLRPVTEQPRSGSEDNVANGITLATQLRTVDQFGALQRAVAQWNGPVSAAVMVFVDPERADIYPALRDITQAYYSSEHVRLFVTVHVVVEDLANRAARPDSAHYPANMLRNVAIANAHTSHVFCVDVADTFPTFGERQALTWLEDVGEISGDVPPRAYAVPTFQSKSRNEQDLPRNKSELLDEVRNPNSGIEPYVGENFESAAVKHSYWMATDEPYAIRYVDDMDLNFIIRTSFSPLMSDLYVGYGKDRCAYSRDVAAAGFQFAVLPYAFLFHLPEAQRSEDVRLDVFLNAAFHDVDLNAGFFHLPSFYQHTLQSGKAFKIESNLNLRGTVCEQPSVDGDDILSTEHRCPSKEINVVYVFDELPEVNLQERTKVIVHEQRLDTVVESLMDTLGVTTFVEISSDDVCRGFSFLLSRTLLEAAIIIHQFADDDTQIAHDHMFSEYRTRGGVDSMSSILRRVVDQFPGPKIFSFDLDSSMTPLTLADMYVRSMLNVATDSDVILLSNHSYLHPFEWTPFNSSELVTKLHPVVEQSKPHWEMYRYAQSVVLKSTQLVSLPALRVPQLPVCQQSRIVSPIVVDVVFVSRNGPMQVSPRAAVIG